MNLGDFLNEFAAKLPILGALAAGVVLALPIFGYFYNRLVASDKNSHSSVYVVIGTLVTLGAGALFSWKAALLYLALFGLSGIFMIIGNFQRDFKKARPRIKRAPYKVNGHLADASMAAEEAARYLAQALKKRAEPLEMLAAISLANHELTTLRLRLSEVQQIQKEA